MPIDVPASPSPSPSPDDTTPEPRPWHGSVGGGLSTFATAADGKPWRIEGEADVEPGGPLGKLGGSLALRGVDKTHAGLVTAGLVYEAGASRPRLVLDLHADLGADLDRRAPLVGAGLRTVLGIYGPLGIALDGGGYFIIDGIDHSRLAIIGSTAIVLKF